MSTTITVDQRRHRRAFLGAVSGHLIEWYDYGVYGFVAIYVRSTGISLAYNLPVALFGGSAPLISAWLIESTGGIASPWYFYFATCVLSLVALLVLKQSDFDRASKAAVNLPIPRADGSLTGRTASADIVRETTA